MGGMNGMSRDGQGTDWHAGFCSSTPSPSDSADNWVATTGLIKWNINLSSECYVRNIYPVLLEARNTDHLLDFDVDILWINVRILRPNNFTIRSVMSSLCLPPANHRPLCAFHCFPRHRPSLHFRIESFACPHLFLNMLAPVPTWKPLVLTRSSSVP